MIILIEGSTYPIGAIIWRGCGFSLVLWIIVAPKVLENYHVNSGIIHLVVRKIFRKTKLTYQGVRNVSFSKKFYVLNEWSLTWWRLILNYTCKPVTFSFSKCGIRHKPFVGITRKFRTVIFYNTCEQLFTRSVVEHQCVVFFAEWN